MGDSLLFGLVLGAGLTGFAVVVYATARAGGLGQLAWALGVAGRASVDKPFEAKVRELLGEPIPPSVTTAGPPPAPPAPPARPGEPLQLLALLQTEARLVDFLLEDISGAGDAQIGSAVRDIHRKAQTALKQHLSFVPVLSGTEGDRVTVPAGFDPSAVRVVGNVTGQPPFTGELQHPGWKVTELKLPPAPQGQDLFVVQPAEVQV